MIRLGHLILPLSDLLTYPECQTDALAVSEVLKLLLVRLHQDGIFLYLKKSLFADSNLFAIGVV